MPYQSQRNPGLVESLRRGLRRRCPRCGQGKMFSGYLSVRHDCASCGMEFEPLRSDDAPPYFTLFIVGHVMVSLYVAAWRFVDAPLWAQATFWCGLTLILSLVLLPFIMFVLLSMVNPKYTVVLIEDPLGQRLVLVGLALMALGFYVIRKIVDIKV